MVGGALVTSREEEGAYLLAFQTVTNDTLVVTETLIFPLPSLVADLGGTLGPELHKIFFVRERQLFEHKLSMKVRQFNYWLIRNKTPYYTKNAVKNTLCLFKIPFHTFSVQSLDKKYVILVKIFP